ncbi:MAG: M14 family zinc carboxypeptidase [Caldilineaceae bacterium]
MHEPQNPLGNRRVRMLIAFWLLCAIGISPYGADWQTAQAQGTLPEGKQPIFMPLVRNGTAPTAEQKSLVARVYFGDAAGLRALAAEYDVWEEAVADQDYVTVYLRPSDVETLRAAGYGVEVDEEQSSLLGLDGPFLGHAIDFESGVLAAAIPGYSCYRTVEETYASLAQLAADHPTLATWSDVGDSYDKVTAGGPAGYDINVLKLTNSAIPGPKSKLMIIAAIHAREYTTAELATRFAEYLVSNYGIDADATWILDHTEIHILPHVNPDGRKIAETGNLWRKNRNPSYGCSSTYGVDLNRNSSFQWGGAGSSGSVCNETYRGPSPASEVEVQTIQNYAASIFDDQRGPGLNDAAPANTTGIFISLHSYGELVLYPWGWSDTVSPNESQHATLGRKFGYYNGHTVCSDCLYIADGTTDDWTYGEFGVASYTFELGTQFFQQCSIFEGTILPTNLPALIYAAKAARLPFQTAAGPDAISLALDQPIVAAGTPVNLSAVVDDTRYDSGGQGVEPTQNIQAARYSVDAPSWAGGSTVAMSVSDGAFNSPAESVTAAVDTSGLSDGQHIIFVEGQDATGQWGVPTAIFVEIGTPPATVFFDDFESDLGWSANPNGTDTATTGQWERGNPEDTNSNGPKQLGTTVSGLNDLVTARLAGSSVGANDIDNGETSIRSPNIAIPAGASATLSFSYYLAHTTNASSADYLRVKVVGASTSTVLEELGAADNDNGVWETFSADISAFAGQTVYLQIEAADAAGGSIVEAGIDDVRITATGSGGGTNQPPNANAGPDQIVEDSDSSGAENITLDGAGSNDLDGTIVAYQWSSDTGVTIPDGASPTASFPVGVHTVTLTVTDDEGAQDSDVVVITVNAPSSTSTVFFDDFESDLGWTVNPSGADTATTGQWERGNPEDVNYNGPKQLGTTVSGSNDLVTARLAGSSAGANDIDNGVTSIRSPNISLPAGASISLSFSSYLAHASNSSSADFLRVSIVGASTQTVFEELGANNDDDAAWDSFNGDISAFAGQTVYLLIEAADAGGASLVEAGVDDVLIEATQ